MANVRYASTLLASGELRLGSGCVPRFRPAAALYARVLFRPAKYRPAATFWSTKPSARRPGGLHIPDSMAGQLELAYRNVAETLTHFNAEMF